MITTSPIDNSESIVRILHKEWVVDGHLQITAFALRQGESYISVNRPAIDTFLSEVSDFVSKHSEYKDSDEGPLAYRQASLEVLAVRNIKVELGQLSADVSVEVEPRDAHYKSHAGIFTKYDEKNIKGGQESVQDKNNCLMPVRAILQKVQHQLLALATLERHEITTSI
jgi:hypothetical protein